MKTTQTTKTTERLKNNLDNDNDNEYDNGSTNVDKEIHSSECTKKEAEASSCALF